MSAFKIGLSALCILIPCFVHAEPLVKCKNYPFLRQGLNLDEFKKCQALIEQQCHVSGEMPTLDCIQNTIKRDPNCLQIKNLAKTIHANPINLSATKEDKFTVINQAFPADKQNNYFVISPMGCMIDTNIDPRALSASLKQQYFNTDLITVNWGEPEFKNEIDGSKTFMVLLRVTKNCLACEIAGWAKVKFGFSDEGELTTTDLESFDQDNPNKRT